MGDHHWDAGLFPDPNGLLYRFDHVGPLAADVGIVAAAVFPHYLGQFHQLLLPGVDRGGIHQAGGEADAPCLHRLPD